jgi:hypothetical protein
MAGCVVSWPVVGAWAARPNGAMAALPRTSVAPFSPSVLARHGDARSRLGLAVADVEMNCEWKKGKLGREKDGPSFYGLRSKKKF